MERLANLFGLISFSMEGATEGRRQYSSYICTALCTVTTAFGGGFVFRDILLLQTSPSLLSSGKEVFASLCLALLVQYVSVSYSAWYTRITSDGRFGAIIAFMDSCGSGMYICAGISRALDHGFFGWTCILSGVVSTIGGGFLASLICGVTPCEAIKKNISYRLIVIQCAIQHYALIQRGVPLVDAQRQTVLQVVLLCELKQLVFNASRYLNSGKWNRKVVVIDIKTAFSVQFSILLSGYRNNRPHWLTQKYAKLHPYVVVKIHEARVTSKRTLHMVLMHYVLEYHIIIIIQ